ncbi:MAG: DUF4112 domain-containing protein [Haloferacaceae archaeon]
MVRPDDDAVRSAAEAADGAADAAAALRRVRFVGWLFDDALRVPGTEFRFGLDALLDFLPGGSFLGGAVALYVVAEAVRCGVPKTTLLRMCLNVALDVSVGAIPFVGVAFDAVWRANERNVALFERHVEAEPSSFATIGVA